MRTVRDLVSALKESRNLERVKKIHSHIRCCGMSNIFVDSTLIDMYARCGDMANARSVFNHMEQKNVVAWNCLIRGYAENGQSEVALEIFNAMEEEGSTPNARTYLAALTACGTSLVAAERHVKTSNRWLEGVKAIQSRAVMEQCYDIFVENSLVDLYAKCRKMDLARGVFCGMTAQDVVSWNVLLQGYIENGESKLAFELFDTMELSSDPDALTYVTALTACAALVNGKKAEEISVWLEKGKAVHSRAVRSSCCNSFVETTLVTMYAKCEKMVHACGVFKSIVNADAASWNALLQGYVENGEAKVALEAFDSMEGICVPDGRTFLAALTACTALMRRKSDKEWLEKGKAVHSMAVSSGCFDSYVQSALINVYGKAGNMDHARKVFDKMRHPNILPWNCLIQGYVDNSDNELALKMVAEMDASGVGQNYATFAAALTACGNLVAFQKGKEFHSEVQGNGLEQNLVVANSLLDVYGKCGRMDIAKQVFDGLAQKNVTIWTSLMCGYGLQGDSKQVFELFESMKAEGLAPDEVTMVCILVACSQAGLVDIGTSHFNDMQLKYGIKPGLVHYNCMIDLLARKNLMEEAVKMVNEMPYEADAVTWRAVLSACRKWNNPEIGKVAYDSLLRLDAKDAAAYNLMANIYTPKEWSPIVAFQMESGRTAGTCTSR